MEIENLKKKTIPGIFKVDIFDEIQSNRTAYTQTSENKTRKNFFLHRVIGRIIHEAT